MNGKLKHVLLFSAVILPLTWQGAHAQNRYAQSKTIEPYELQDASKIHRSRPKLEVVNTGPEISNRMRGPEAQRTVVIQVSPPEAPPDEVYVINSGPSGRRSGSRPGTIEVDLTNPPPAGFTTNIPFGGVNKPRALPPGTTTNMLGNQYVSGRLQSPATGGRPAGRLLNAAPRKTSAPQPTAMTYPAVVGSGSSGSSATRTESKVSGQLTGRGALLNSASK